MSSSPSSPSSAPRAFRPSLDSDALKALDQACDCDDIAPLRELLNVYLPSTSALWTGLARAFQGGHLKMARFLLELGVPFSDSIIHAAMDARDFAALDLLREFGWDVNKKLTTHLEMPIT